MSEQALLSCQKEIRRLRGLVGQYGGFYDEVKKVCDNPKIKTVEQLREAIEKLITECDD